MSPAIVDKKEKQQHIIEAALKVFSKQGYTAASMNKIGEAAGVGKSTLYEYFESKAEVFIAAFGAWVDQICFRMTTLMAKRTNPVDKLYVVAELTNEIGSAQTPGNRMYLEMVDQMYVETGVLYHQWELIDGKAADIRRILTDVILHGIATGAFKAEIARDVEQIVINIMGCMDGLLFNNLLGNQHFNLKWQVNYYLNNLVATIRADRDPLDTTNQPKDLKAAGSNKA